MLSENLLKIDVKLEQNEIHLWMPFVLIHTDSGAYLGVK